MLVMMGRNDQNVMANSGLNTMKKDITSPFGCRIEDSPFSAKVKDQLAGEIREGKTILVTDLPYRIKTVTSSHDIGVGLGDMGWDLDVFKVLESTEMDPEKKLKSTINKVVRHLEADNDAGSTTVHFLAVV